MCIYDKNYLWGKKIEEIKVEIFVRKYFSA